jgi:hypothetical protein
MVAITVIASHALLEIDMGQVGDQLREDGSTYIHPPLFRRCRSASPAPIFDRFQFKSFFRLTLFMYLMLRALTKSAKYFTGH